MTKLNVDSGNKYTLRMGGTRTYPAHVGQSVNVNVLEGGSLPLGGVQGDIIIKRSSADFDAEWTAPANSAEQDNTLPITSAAVYTEIGNINALLATI